MRIRVEDSLNYLLTKFIVKLIRNFTIYFEDFISVSSIYFMFILGTRTNDIVHSILNQNLKKIKI